MSEAIYYVNNAGGKHRCCVRETKTDDIVALCRSNGLASQICDRMNRGEIVDLDRVEKGQ